MRPSLGEALRLKFAQNAAKPRPQLRPNDARARALADLDRHVTAAQEQPELYAGMDPVARNAITTRALNLANRAAAGEVTA